MAMLLLTAGMVMPGAALAAPAAQTQSDLEHLRMLSGQEFEIDFMSMMIEHHQSAIDMAELVPARAKHQEIKDVARNIISDQTREIDEMTQWLSQWYNATPKQGMMHEMPGMSAADMSALARLQGDDFDKAFLTMMRMHHQGAVEMASLVGDRTVHAELKTLAQNVISSQTAEIREFEDWLKAWYNLDVTAGSTAGDMMPPDVMAGGNQAGMPRTGSASRDEGLLISLVGIALLAVSALMGGIWLRRHA